MEIKNGGSVKYQFPNMAKLIRVKRNAKDLGQIQVSEAIGGKCKGQTCSNIERGIASVPLKHAKGICDLLEISKEEFMQAHIEDVILKIDKALK